MVSSTSSFGFCIHEMPCCFVLWGAQNIALLQDPFATKEEYKDSWFDKFMVDYFAKQMSKQLGGASA